MLAAHLKQILAQQAQAIFPGITLPEFSVEHPEDEALGDWATNIAFVLSGQLKQSPRAIAEQLVAALPEVPEVSSWTVAGAGFINMSIKSAYYRQNLSRILTEADRYGTSDQGQGQRILFEFGQPNTHKIPHIGHLFSYCYGESCVRLLEANGYEVFRANYQGDIGPHVAKCLWAYRQHSQPDPDSLAEKVAYLQECYQHGAQMYESDPAAKEEIDHINQTLYQRDAAIVPDWEKTRQWSLDYYRDFESRIGTTYDKRYLESEVSELGVKTVTSFVGSLFERDDATVIFRGEPYGLHTRVFINKFGIPTYEAKEVGLSCQKAQDFSFDLSYITTANEQSDYWQVVKKALELMFPAWENKIHHLSYGMVNLTTGKMSSRSGQIISALSLVEITKDRVSSAMRERSTFDKEEIERVAEVVALGAIKYAFLKSSPQKDISFDMEKSIAFEGNAGPYLQYTYARIKSILRKTQRATGLIPEKWEAETPEEQAVLRWLARYHDEVVLAIREFAPHTLASYLFELARRFSQLYDRHPILHEDEVVAQGRLALSAAVSQVIKNGLGLLGIEVAERI